MKSNSSHIRLISSQGGAEYNSVAGVLGSNSAWHETQQRRAIKLLRRPQYSFQLVSYGLDYNNSYRHFMGEQSMMGNILGAHTLYTSLQCSRPHTALVVSELEGRSSIPMETSITTVRFAM